MKQKLTKIIVLSLILSMVFNVAVFAAPASDKLQEEKNALSGSISSNVTQPVIRFVAYVGQSFTLDPFDSAHLGQVVSPTYYVASKSSIPIAVSVYAQYVSVTNGVEILTTSTNNIAKKQIYMWVEPAKAFQAGAVSGGTNINDSVSINGTKVDYNQSPVMKSDLMPIGMKTQPIYFLLENADWTANVINNGSTVGDTSITLSYNGITAKEVAAAFKLNGDMTPNIAWKPGDVAVRFVYSTRAVTRDTYAALVPTIVPNTTRAISGNKVEDIFNGNNGGMSVPAAIIFSKTSGAVFKATMGTATHINDITSSVNGTVATWPANTWQLTGNKLTFLPTCPLMNAGNGYIADVAITFNTGETRNMKVTIAR